MNSNSCLTTACRYCRFYKPEGRRGGTCQLLSVPVQANWKACSQGSPPFTKLEEAPSLYAEVSLTHCRNIPCVSDDLAIEATIPVLVETAIS